MGTRTPDLYRVNRPRVHEVSHQPAQRIAAGWILAVKGVYRAESVEGPSHLGFRVRYPGGDVQPGRKP